ncbi:MAG TPA: hypothetical protein DCF46_02700 [Porphyromonadaceae bacterium]|jgi:hypothetical protein|nr:DUF4827 family protein [Proteiniphilum sp. UBA5218]HAC72496.1 hypothetical protein [Porphyromonadaceae bacterium]HBC37440.1 hypothetical protein [Porphyromonadaceae bacterium]HBK41912.1 hypothetical protein [Porphyromonadaceae bacterium]HCA99862.1 hypothetical protein [Porphyromonadaceae bacterium]HCF80634.1 hypothetical protein [Porphyromonadaceae bacterium]
MKKKHYIILFLFGIGLVTISCNKTKTYVQFLKEENKAIDKFVSQNNLVILEDFPKDTIFKANEFYCDPATGVYFNIIERGVPHTNAKLGEEVYIRFSGLRYFANEKDTISYSNMDLIRSPFPEILIYRGPVTMRNRDLYSGTTPAWAVPLSSIGHNGKVKLIVPFNMGSNSDRSNFRLSPTTTYYDNVQYRFESQL